MYIDSIMHYGAFAFAKDPKRPTIVPKKIGAELGQRRELSKVIKTITFVSAPT